MTSSGEFAESTPITLIGGYLGAGKTTLINRLLAHPRLPEGTAVLVNDFGDINIDESRIRSTSADGTVIGLSNGCVCCSISDDLSKALDQLNQLPINHVILETSGVAEPGRVWGHCQYPGFTPKAAIVVVDANDFEQRSKDKYVGSLVRAQVDQADFLIISKAELNPTFELPRLIPQFLNTDSGLIDTVLGYNARNDLETPKHQGDLQAKQTPSLPRFASQTWQQQEIVGLAAFEWWLNSLPTEVHRVKGWVNTLEGLYTVDRVGETISLKPIGEEQCPENLGVVLIYWVDPASAVQTGGFAPDQITMALSSYSLQG